MHEKTKWNNDIKSVGISNSHSWIHMVWHKKYFCENKWWLTLVVMLCAPHNECKEILHHIDGCNILW